MKTQRIAIACGVALVIVTLTATAEARENMLSNGGFEQGITGWQPDPKHQLIRPCHSFRFLTLEEATPTRVALLGLEIWGWLYL